MKILYLISLLKYHNHCSNCSFILVEPLEPKCESLHGPYPGPANKYTIINIKLVLLSLSTTVDPVHEKPPLHKGWHKAHNR